MSSTIFFSNATSMARKSQLQVTCKLVSSHLSSLQFVKMTCNLSSVCNVRNLSTDLVALLLPCRQN